MEVLSETSSILRKIQQDIINVLGSSSKVPLNLAKWYAVKHNYITQGVFNGYTGQLHVSAFTGHLQVVLREIKVLLYTLSVHVVHEISTYEPYCLK